MNEVYFLILGRLESSLHILNQESYSKRIALFGLKRSQSLAIRNLGMPDLLIQPNNREVMGIVYSDFNVVCGFAENIMQLSSPYFRLLQYDQAKHIDRYKDDVTHNALEVSWGDLSECILEPASLMGDSWLEDQNGNLKGLLLELKYF